MLRLIGSMLMLGLAASAALWAAAWLRRGTKLEHRYRAVHRPSQVLGGPYHLRS